LVARVEASLFYLAKADAISDLKRTMGSQTTFRSPFEHNRFEMARMNYINRNIDHYARTTLNAVRKESSGSTFDFDIVPFRHFEVEGGLHVNFMHKDTGLLAYNKL